MIGPTATITKPADHTVNRVAIPLTKPLPGRHYRSSVIETANLVMIDLQRLWQPPIATCNTLNPPLRSFYPQ